MDSRGTASLLKFLEKLAIDLRNNRFISNGTKIKFWVFVLSTLCIYFSISQQYDVKFDLANFLHIWILILFQNVLSCLLCPHFLYLSGRLEIFKVEKKRKWSLLLLQAREMARVDLLLSLSLSLSHRIFEELGTRVDNLVRVERHDIKRLSWPDFIILQRADLRSCPSLHRSAQGWHSRVGPLMFSSVA